MYDIEVINTLARTVDYSTEAVREYEQGLGDRIEEYTDTFEIDYITCLLYTSPSPRDRTRSRMPSSA